MKSHECNKHNDAIETGESHRAMSYERMITMSYVRMITNDYYDF